MKTTNFAREIGVSAAHLRNTISQKGSYYGITPVKLPNGQLDWPDDAIAQFKKGGDK